MVCGWAALCCLFDLFSIGVRSHPKDLLIERTPHNAGQANDNACAAVKTIEKVDDNRFEQEADRRGDTFELHNGVREYTPQLYALPMSFLCGNPLFVCVSRELSNVGERALEAAGSGRRRNLDSCLTVVRPRRDRGRHGSCFVDSWLGDHTTSRPWTDCRRRPSGLRTYCAIVCARRRRLGFGQLGEFVRKKLANS